MYGWIKSEAQLLNWLRSQFRRVWNLSSLSYRIEDFSKLITLVEESGIVSVRNVVKTLR